MLQACKTVKVVLSIPFDTGDGIAAENKSLKRGFVKGKFEGAFGNAAALAVGPLNCVDEHNADICEISRVASNNCLGIPEGV